MKILFILILGLSLQGLAASSTPTSASADVTTAPATKSLSYSADVYDLEGKNLLFKIQLKREQKDNDLKISSKFIDAKTNENALLESAEIKADTAEFTDYTAQNLQTSEKGHVLVVGDKVKMEYQIKDKQSSKEIAKPTYLVAPANFEAWLEKNFATLKEKKSMSVDFLIWDRMETFSFKVSYLGEQDLDGQKTQAFKMNIDNFLIAAFISPIRIWYTQDMSHILRFKGRVAVKKKNKDGSFGDLDADVRYKYN